MMISEMARSHMISCRPSMDAMLQRGFKTEGYKQPTDGIEELKTRMAYGEVRLLHVVREQKLRTGRLQLRKVMSDAPKTRAVKLSSRHIPSEPVAREQR